MMIFIRLISVGVRSNEDIQQYHSAFVRNESKIPKSKYQLGYQAKCY